MAVKFYVKVSNISDNLTSDLEKAAGVSKKVEYFLKLASFSPDVIRNHSGAYLAKAAILAAIRLEGSSNIELYDNFITVCGQDYEKSHTISG